MKLCIRPQQEKKGYHGRYNKWGVHTVAGCDYLVPAGQAVDCALEDMQVVSHQGVVFDHILACHSGGHAKDKKLHKKVKDKYLGISKTITNFFVQSCPTCAKHKATNPKK